MKGGRVDRGPKETHFLAPKAPKIEKMAKMTLFGASGAKNLEKFLYFHRISPIFVKVENVIA